MEFELYTFGNNIFELCCVVLMAEGFIGQGYSETHPLIRERDRERERERERDGKITYGRRVLHSIERGVQLVFLSTSS